MNRRHEVKKLSFEGDPMRLEVDGKEYVFDLNGNLTTASACFSGRTNEVRDFGVRLWDPLAAD